MDLTEPAWYHLQMTPFDLETTGVDVETDRVVTCAAGRVGNGPAVMRNWLVDPGVPIPEEATAVHGITTDHARQHGREPVDCLDEITRALADSMAAGVPVVGMNLAYDLTLLDRECRRYGVEPLDQRVDLMDWLVLDALVLDKRVDPYRRGSRRLGVLAEVYGVSAGQLHDAGADALMAARVVYRIGRRCQVDPDVLARYYAGLGRRSPEEIVEAYKILGAMTMGELHEAQAYWRAEQQQSLAAYFARLGRAEDAQGVDDSWPLKPYEYGDGDVF